MRFLIFLFFLPLQASLAQPASLEFQRLTLDDGLTDYVIMALERDTAGFLWIGTQSGLNRYDGARIRPIAHDPEAGRALLDNFIQALEVDPSSPGVLWVATGAGGLGRVDTNTGQATVFTAETSSLSSDKIRALHVDQSGTLWVGTEDAGLNRYRPEGASFEVFGSSPERTNALVSDSILVLYEPPSAPGTLWIGTTAGLSVFDVAKERFQNYVAHPEARHGLRHKGVTAIAEAGGVMWIGTSDGVLYRFDPAIGVFEPLNRLLGEAAIPSISVLAASRMYEQVLWIGTRGQGVLAFHTRDRTVEQFTHDPDNPASLSRAEVISILEDRSGLLWVGTFIGLNKALLKGRRFLPHRIPSGQHRATAGSAVMTLYEAPSEPGIVWLGSMRNGLLRYDRHQNTYTAYFTRLEHPLNLVFAIHEDRLGHFWLGGTAHAALYQMDRATGAVQDYPLPQGTDIWIKQIYEAPTQPDYLWVATRGLGLLKIDIRSGELVRQYTNDATMEPRLSVNHLWSVHEAPWEQGVLWIGTHGGGLLRLDTRTETVVVIRQGEGSCLPSDRIVSIESGPEGILWLGTFEKGLVRYAVRKGTCQVYTQADGLANTDVGAIFADRQGRLWLTTSNGLSLFNPELETFTTFTTADGLQGNIFQYFARHQNDTGELFIGGDNGFNIFHPDSIDIDTTPPNMVLTRVLVDGQPQELERSEAGFEPLTLTYQQNDLMFEFSALDLRQPSKIQYKYWLEGVDTTWQSLGNQAYVRFPSLSPKTYTFRVAGTNRDGYWNEEGVALRFRIKPPFWLAWWFWTLVALFGTALIVAAYQYRIAQLVRLERIRHRIADDLHDDIGSKISNVALRLDLAGRNTALRDEERRQLNELAQTARGVVDTLRDVVWFVDAEHDHLPGLVARMEQFAEQMLRGRSYSFTSPDDLPPVVLGMEPRRHLYLFFKEALHNAVRHSQAEHITIRIDYASRRLKLSVIDNGTGFDVTGVHRGRGLQTLRRRAEQLGGPFELTSTPGQGTCVSLEMEIA